MNLKGLLQENRQKILSLCYSVGALAVYNVIIQFYLYPSFADKLGAERYGVALSAISVCAIIACTCGAAVNNTRMLGLDKGRTNNGDYNLILLLLCVLGGAVGIVYLFWLDIATPLTVLLYALLIVITTVRYYADVEFRIKTDFFRYMLFYLLISAGYIVGVFLFKLTDQWMLAMILGELAAVGYVCIRGHIFRPPFLQKSAHFRPIFSGIGFLFISLLFENIALHADRILLLTITGDGTNVTVYYAASLVGKIVALLTVSVNALVISYLARYQGGLRTKMWNIVIVVALAFGAAALGGCMLVSPWLIELLYHTDILNQALLYLFPAILGQILYFISGVLVMFLLRFTGEKKQFIFNTVYLAEFLACVIGGTILFGMNGFVWSIVLANGIRFVGVVLWGMIESRRKKADTASGQAISE